MLRLLTANQVAQMLCVTVSYVYALARRDEIPAIRIGHYWRFDKEAIQAWLTGGINHDDQEASQTRRHH